MTSLSRLVFGARSAAFSNTRRALSTSSPHYAAPPASSPASTSSSPDPWNAVVGASSSRADWNVLAFASTVPGQGTSPAERWEGASKQREHQLQSLKKPAGVYSGRSIEVTRENVMGAYGELQRLLQANNVRKELRRAARHEKPTDKRRRLASERHRKRFAHVVAQRLAVARAIRQRAA